MGVVNVARGPWEWVKRRLDAHERRIRALETAPRIGNTSIDHGDLIVNEGSVVVTGGTIEARYPDGSPAAQLGRLVVDGAEVYGMRTMRPDGTAMLGSWASPDGTATRLELRDHAGNLIFGTDEAAGQGIARPRLGLAFGPAGDAASSPLTSTTATAWSTLAIADIIKQSAQMSVDYQQRTTSTTAELRVLVDGVQVYGPITTNLGAGQNSTGPFAIDGDHESPHRVEVQGRVASGTGAIGLVVIGAAFWPA